MMYTVIFHYTLNGKLMLYSDKVTENELSWYIPKTTQEIYDRGDDVVILIINIIPVKSKS